jgi:hypothetical protein
MLVANLLSVQGKEAKIQGVGGMGGGPVKL